MSPLYDRCSPADDGFLGLESAQGVTDKLGKVTEVHRDASAKVFLLKENITLFFLIKNNKHLL